MNSLTIVLGSIIFLGAGYFFYARLVEKIFEVDPSNVTPANEFFDGVDYVPARNWLILFSHHFASIAGAGPIVGPVIAVALWGWWPALVWIVVGTVFMGGVHDFASLMISVRHGGRSITDVAESVISRRAKLIFLGFVWLALILVIAVFAAVCAKTLTTEPKTVVPCFGLVGVALLVGFVLHRLRFSILLATVIGLTLLLACIFLGEMFPVEFAGNGYAVWIIVLLAYAFIASVTPVHVLLQPRDYIASFLLYFGIAAGVLGIVVSRPVMDVAGFGGWRPAGGGGWLWPMLFVTVACGANSGFHALVSSGTTSKQLASERDAKRIGYGGMVLEAVLAVLALVAVSAGLGAAGLEAALAKGGSGPIGAFGAGYGALTRSILFGKGSMIAVLILNAFILTTLDTATRICRYLSEELFKIKNRFFSTFVVVFISGALALSGKWSEIWPMFGASNQLVAALTFVVVSSWLLCRGKSLKFTFLPAIFMLITSIGALLYQIAGFVRDKEVVLALVSIALMVMAGIMVADVLSAVKKRRRIGLI
ncbi:MAG: carbon starvation protein A [Candidatus Omnitrophica bacterium]|nr:carbon starvation protein A [Candidatus Omnitrophota bacterium]